MTNPTYHITADSWGRKDSVAPSQFSVRVGSDQRRVIFRGDSYWQWSDTCLRNRGANCCWTQALHDALVGWHSCVLHTGDTLVVLPHHPDYDRVRQLVDDVDSGRTTPSNNPLAPDLR